MRVWLERLFRYRQLGVGVVIITAVVLFGVLGPLFWDVNGAKVGSFIPDLPPSLEHPLALTRWVATCSPWSLSVRRSRSVLD